MAILEKSVRIDGAGDYTDLIVGINDILASGVAATGYYESLILTVDSGYYTGSFSVNIPFSGKLSLIGSGSWFEPTGVCYISGSYLDADNFYISNFKIIGSGTSPAFSIYSDTYARFYQTSFIDSIIGIESSGNVYVSECEANGLNAGTFIVSPTGHVYVSNSDIGNFKTGLSGIDVYLTNSKIINTTRGIVSNDCSVSDSLIVGTSGIIVTSGSLLVSYSTVDSSWQCITANDVSVNIKQSILETDYTYSITGSNVSGDVTDVCFNLGIWDPSLSISGTYFTEDPLFNNKTTYDYRLKFKDTIGSPCIEAVTKTSIHEDVTFTTEQSHLLLSALINSVPKDADYQTIRDRSTTVPPIMYRSYVYKQGNTLILSDYLKETTFAELYEKEKFSTYILRSRADLTVSGITLVPAIDNNKYANFPYDWDTKKFNTTEITDEHEYLIPRSVLDVSEAVSGYLGEYLSNIAFGVIDKTMIFPYLRKDLRGVSLDYDLGTRGSPIVWLLEGTSQSLLKLYPYTGEVLESYPLMTRELPTNSGMYVIPSGLIFNGVDGDKFKYIFESNVQREILTDNPDGKFKWIPTMMDANKDVRGLLAYKGNLFATMGEYITPIEDRETVPTGIVSGSKILMFNNNDVFTHYIANYTTAGGPSAFILASGNSYPTDITVYEDGKIYIGDYLNTSGLYVYKLAYDYALIQSSYDNDSIILLREDYENVEL